MIFGKFIGVVPGSEVPPAPHHGKNRQLDHIHTRDEVVEELEIQRMDDIFRIVHDKNFKPYPVFFFVMPDARINPVEAVCLIGRPVLGTDNAVDVAVFFSDQSNFALGLEVIGVGADKNLIICVGYHLYCVIQHAPNNGGLIPAWNHDRHRLLRRRQQLRLTQGRELVADKYPTIDLVNDIRAINDKLVNAADDKDNPKPCQQNMNAQQQIGHNQV